MNLVFSGRNAASQEDVESPPQEHFRTLREPGSQHLSSINHIRRVGVQRFISWILFHFTIKRRSERFDRRLFRGFPKTAKNPPTNSLAHRSLCGLSKKAVFEDVVGAPWPTLPYRKAPEAACRASAWLGYTFTRNWARARSAGDSEESICCRASGMEAGLLVITVARLPPAFISTT